MINKAIPPGFHPVRRDRLGQEHPLKHILAIELAKDGTRITTADIHLARGSGEAVHHA